MREIKFRAWDKRDKRMYGCNSLARLHFDKGLPYCFYTWDDFMLLKKDLELMQFTGLKDKNGKEIYEGDIVKYTRKHWYCPGHSEHNKDLVNICTIYWDDEKHSFCNDMRDKTGRIFASGYLGFDDERADKNIIEIIGNVCENQELLNKKEVNDVNADQKKKSK